MGGGRRTGAALDTLSDATDNCARRYLITCKWTQWSKEETPLTFYFKMWLFRKK